MILMKKFKELLVIVILFVPIITTNLYGQNFGFSFGVMKNYTSKNLLNSRYSFFPEISLSGKFFLNYTNWEVAISYIDDGLEFDEIPGRGFYWDSKDYEIASRLIISVEDIFTNDYLPKILTGISYHFITSELLRTGPHTADYIPDEHNQRSYLDFGVGYKVVELIGIDIGLRYLALIPLDKSDLLHNQVKHSLVFTFKL
jgi:hypothetical protein